jgi:hypothetical protein
MLLLLGGAIDDLNYLLNGVFYRVCRIPHVMDDHVQEDLGIHKLFF